MGTSHRQKPVKALVGEIRAGLREPVRAARTATRSRSATAARRLLGRRRVRPDRRALAAPDLRRVLAEVRDGRAGRAVPRRADRDRGRARRRARPGGVGGQAAEAGADVIAWAHNETSTGVMAPVVRPAGAGEALVLIDATSGAGGLPVDVAAGRRLLLRAAEELRRRRRPVAGAAEPGRAGADRRARRLGERWIPASLSLQTALENSLKDQTYNTPAVATLFLLADQIRWMLDGGGLDCVRRAHARVLAAAVRVGRAHPATRRRSSPTRRSARWSSARSTSTPTSTRRRSPRRCARTASSTSSRTASSAATSCAIGMFPAVDPADVQALTACIDWIVERTS